MGENNTLKTLKGCGVKIDTLVVYKACSINIFIADSYTGIHWGNSVKIPIPEIHSKLKFSEILFPGFVIKISFFFLQELTVPSTNKSCNIKNGADMIIPREEFSSITENLVLSEETEA